MAWCSKGRCLGVLFSAVLSLCGTVEGGLSQTATLLPVSKGALTLGEWNSNFAGALAAADAYHVPLLVFFGGLSCGHCEELQRACLTEEFLAWQNSHKMLMVFATHNGNGDASGFSKPVNPKGFPYLAIYWNRSGSAPAKDSEYYRTFHGLDGEMLVKGGGLAQQLIGSIDSVAGEYDFSSLPDISARAEMLYQDPVTTRLSYAVELFTGLDASDALAPQVVYNLKGSKKPVLKKVSGKLPTGVKLRYVDGKVVLSGKAKKVETGTYVFSRDLRLPSRSMSCPRAMSRRVDAPCSTACSRPPCRFCPQAGMAVLWSGCWSLPPPLATASGRSTRISRARRPYSRGRGRPSTGVRRG